MNILVTGATGFIGTKICRALTLQKHCVTALSRDAQAARKKVPELIDAYTWDPVAGPAPCDALDGVEAVINLLGETVVGRWTSAKKKAIRESRVLGTRNLVTSLGRVSPKPRILISASAIGYYGDRGDEKLAESSAPGQGFLASLGQAWEAEARKAEDYGICVSRLRIGVVLASGGGALGAMLLPFQLGLGGALGSGQQWWSWIHCDDLVGLVGHLLESTYPSVVNGVAPSPVSQREFSRVLGRVLSRPAFLPAPAFALRLALGGFATELLSSKRVLPAAAERLGYTFHHPDLENALRNVLRK